MAFTRTWLFVACLAMGCGGREMSDASTDAPGPKSIRADMDRFQAELAELKSLTNIYRQPVGKETASTPPPKINQTEGEIELLDLNLVFRRVKFDRSIDGLSAIFFSETEITNQMYATYLNDTGRYRDDSAFEQAAARGLARSTASPGIHIEDPSSLWRNDRFPEQRGDHPVSYVTIGEATEFCNWLTARYSLNGSIRLPTEEEWLSAAYGEHRQYPWGDEKKDWTSKSTEPVNASPDLRTPDGLFGMWGNVSELVLSDSDGYGGKIRDIHSPFITVWLGSGYKDKLIRGRTIQPRQDYWGYTHSVNSRSTDRGFRIVYVPEE